MCMHRLMYVWPCIPDYQSEFWLPIRNAFLITSASNVGLFSSVIARLRIPGVWLTLPERAVLLSALNVVQPRGPWPSAVFEVCLYSSSISTAQVFAHGCCGELGHAVGTNAPPRPVVENFDTSGTVVAIHQPQSQEIWKWRHKNGISAANFSWYVAFLPL